MSSIIRKPISKTPKPPKFMPESLQVLLTNLCFGKDITTTSTDLIFVYGTPFFITEISNHISNLLSQKLASKVLITGGIVLHGEPYLQQKSEAKLIYDAVIVNNFQNVEFFLEEKSQNTLENITEGIKILDFRHYKSICFIFPSHGATRGYLTLKKFFSTGQIFQCPYDVCYPGEKQKISKDNWHTFDLGISRVWGEFLRIKEYGSRGDIAYDEEVKNLVLQIEETIES